MKGTTLEVDLEVGTRYYLDGRPGELINLASTGFANFVYDDKNYATNIQRDDVHEWLPCLETRVELQSAEAAEFFTKLFAERNASDES